MRRRRTRKYTWLPVLGQDTGNTPEWTNCSFSSNVNIPTDNTSGVYVVPVLADRPDEAYGVTDQIGHVLTNDYFIRRIVGKLHVAMDQDGQPYQTGVPPSPAAAEVAAGFFVARASAQDEVTGGDYPIGLAPTTNIANFENYSPLSRAASREPWIWRRSWNLSNRLDDETLTLPGSQPKNGNRFWPATNAEYGSVLDGPHIDAKTARRVTNDERLFFAISATMPTSFTPGQNPANDGTIQFTLDVRILGALRRSKNRGAF